MRRALAIHKASFGPYHPSVARDLNHLARLLQNSNVAEAESLCRRALVIYEASLGEVVGEVASNLNNLTILLRATDRLAEAEPLIRRALAIDEALFGLEHPTVGGLLNNLAKLLQDTHRLTEAEPLYRRAVASFMNFERKTGDPHPHRDAALRNYSGLLAAMGKSEAEIRAAIASLVAEGAPRDPR